jgi:ubiquinone/menaquinone biosynthesis C-methylase UbiE
MTTDTGATRATAGNAAGIDPADAALKAKHRAMWALGDYHAVATEIIPALGPVLVDAAGISPDHHVLDVAAGAGNVAIPAAATGARVVATDLTPELIERGRADVQGSDVRLEWQVADAEQLPFDDGAFDVVTSCVGAMFAPHHQQTADELVRVCRPGGRIGLISWTPAGFIGQMFATMKPYAPAPPPGAQPPPLWGSEEHVRTLLGHRVTEVSASKASLVVDEFATPAEFRDYFKANYGPTIAVYRAIADDEVKVAALDRELEELAHRFDRGTSGSSVLDWEYLLLTCERT